MNSVIFERFSFREIDFIGINHGVVSIMIELYRFYSYTIRG